MDRSVREKSLQELEGEDWGEPGYPSYLVTECHRLRRVPLQEFGPEDLRIMIGQQIGVEYFVPLALEQLTANPWISGDLYDGDLLVSVLGLPYSYWQQYPQQEQRFQAVVEVALREARFGRQVEEPDKDTLRRLEQWHGSRSSGVERRG